MTLHSDFVVIKDVVITTRVCWDATVIGTIVQLSKRVDNFAGSESLIVMCNKARLRWRRHPIWTCRSRHRETMSRLHVLLWLDYVVKSNHDIMMTSQEHNQSQITGNSTICSEAPSGSKHKIKAPYCWTSNRISIFANHSWNRAWHHGRHYWDYYPSTLSLSQVTESY